MVPSAKNRRARRTDANIPERAFSVCEAAGCNVAKGKPGWLWADRLDARKCICACGQKFSDERVEWARQQDAKRKAARLQNGHSDRQREAALALEDREPTRRVTFRKDGDGLDAERLQHALQPFLRKLGVRFHIPETEIDSWWAEEQSAPVEVVITQPPTTKEALNKEIGAARTLGNKIAAHQKRIAASSEKVRSLRAELETEEQKHAQSQTDLGELQQELDAAQKRIDELQEQLAKGEQPAPTAPAPVAMDAEEDPIVKAEADIAKLQAERAAADRECLKRATELEQLRAAKQQRVALAAATQDASRQADEATRGMQVAAPPLPVAAPGTRPKGPERRSRSADGPRREGRSRSREARERAAAAS